MDNFPDNSSEPQENTSFNEVSEPIEVKKKRGFFKRLLRFFVFLFSFFVLLIISGFYLAKVYEDEIVERVTLEVNKYLDAEIKVSGIEFSFIKRFPNASVNFKNVRIINDLQNDIDADTLLQAENLFLKFSISDVWNKTYNINKIEIDKGEINLLYDKNGKENFIFWKQDSSSNNTSFSLKLEEVKLVDVRLNYYQMFKDQEILTDVKELVFSGDFSDEEYQLDIDGDLFVKRFRNKKQNILHNNKTKIDLALNVNNNNNVYDFLQGKFKIDNIWLNANGQINNLGEESDLNISFSGNKIDLVSLSSLLPKEYSEKFSYYHTKGIIDFNAKVTGIISPKKSPLITFNFLLKDAFLEEPNTGARLSDIYFSGEFKSINKGELKLDSLQFLFDDKVITSSGSIRNFQRPKINLNSTGHIDLNHLKDFLNITQVDALSGDLKFKVHVSGLLNSFEEFSLPVINKLNKEAELILSNFSLVVKENKLEDINAELSIDGNKISSPKITGLYNTHQFELKSTIQNLLPWMLMPEEKLKLNGDLFIDEININEYTSSSKIDTKEDSPVNLPTDLIIHYKVRTNKFVYNNFEASKLQTNFSFKPNYISLNQLKAETCSGKVFSKISIKQELDKSFQFSSNTTLQGVEVDKVFNSFNNFDQETVKGENLVGKLDAIVSFNSALSKGLTFKEENIESTINVTLKNGEINNLPAIQDIVSYLGENKVASAILDMERLQKESKHISFKKIENQIVIKNKEITIPYMNISSSVLDINLAGNHFFNGKINYLLDFRLDDLTKKADNSEYGYVVDDGTGMRLFVKILGTTDNPYFELNKEAKKTYKKQKRQDEIKNIKKIFKDEFSGKTTPEEKPDDKIIIEWEEEEVTVEEEEETKEVGTDALDKKLKQEDKEKQAEDKEKKWLEKIGVKEEEESKDKPKTTIEFEED